MDITLTPTRAARLFASLAIQQQALLAACAQDSNRRSVVALPPCPACRMRSEEVSMAADGTSIQFAGCEHRFSLSRRALLAGLCAARTA